ncbi:MAG: sigma-70 family RNA polymerase sigma factor [Planctomycetota bacterium]|nr:sigma-70 family RNA polymerase sigma factor [Planctomycetota bacterium]
MSSEKSAEKQKLDAAVATVRGGDADAFEAVVRQCEQSLRAWLAIQCPPGVDVDEIAQRSFVAAFTRLDDYQLGTDFAAWLFTIARYQLRTETTRLRRLTDYHARYAPDLLQKELNRRAEEPTELQQSRLDQLKTCLEGLGDHLRRYIDWRYDEQIPLEEMANRTGRSVPAIKKQLWQLRRKLHTCIEEKLAAEDASVTNRAATNSGN